MAMTEIKKIIGFDLDDVLLDFRGPLINWHNITHGTNLTRDHYVHFELEKIWGCDLPEAINRIWDFYQSDLHKNANFEIKMHTSSNVVFDAISWAPRHSSPMYVPSFPTKPAQTPLGNHFIAVHLHSLPMQTISICVSQCFFPIDIAAPFFSVFFPSSSSFIQRSGQ